MSLAHRALAEFVGTALLMVVVLAAGQLAAVLGGTADWRACVCAGLLLGAGCLLLGAGLTTRSGAQLNPAVTLFAHIRGRLDAQDALAYATAQVCGALLGVVAAHALFGLPLVQASRQPATTLDERFIEVAATALVLLLPWLAARLRPMLAPIALALAMALAYGGSALRATANPALMLARILTDTPVGVAAASLPSLLIAQLGAVAIAFGCVLLLPPEPRPESAPESKPPQAAA